MIFAHCIDDLHRSDWSQPLAWIFAQLSEMAYRDCWLTTDQIAQRFEADGCERITAGSQSMLVLWDATDVVLAFEGSNPTRDDWRANADTSVTSLGDYSVHRGFKLEYLKVTAALTLLLNERQLWPGRRLHVTGHSQGGAISEIAACQRAVHTCYTFGTPKTFASTGGHPCQRAWYHWHSNDVVPHLPLGRKFDHRAPLCYVRQDKGAIPEPGFWRLCWLKAWSYRPGDTIKDHSARSYVEALTP